MLQLPSSSLPSLQQLSAPRLSLSLSSSEGLEKESGYSPECPFSSAVLASFLPLSFRERGSTAPPVREQSPYKSTIFKPSFDLFRGNSARVNGVEWDSVIKQGEGDESPVGRFCADSLYIRQDRNQHTVRIYTVLMTPQRNLALRELGYVSGRFTEGWEEAFQVRAARVFGGGVVMVVSVGEELKDSRLIVYRVKQTETQDFSINMNVKAAALIKNERNGYGILATDKGLVSLQFQTRNIYFQSHFKFKDIKLDIQYLCPKWIELDPIDKLKFNLISSCETGKKMLLNLEINSKNNDIVEINSSLDITEFNSPIVCNTKGYTYIGDIGATKGNMRINAYTFGTWNSSSFPLRLESISNMTELIYMSCDLRGSLVHLLTSDTAGSKYVLTLNDNPNQDPYQRIHSIYKVDKRTDRISSGFLDDSSINLVFYASEHEGISFKPLLVRSDGPQMMIFADSIGEKTISAIMTSLSGENQTITAHFIVQEFQKVGKVGIKDDIKSLAFDKVEAYELSKRLQFYGPIFKIEYIPKNREGNENTLIQPLTPATDQFDELKNLRMNRYRILNANYVLAETIRGIYLYKFGKPVMTIPILGNIVSSEILTFGKKDNEGFDVFAFMIISSNDGQQLAGIYSKNSKWFSFTSDIIDGNLEHARFTSLDDEHSIFSMVCVNNRLNQHLLFQQFKIQERRVEFIGIQYRRQINQRIYSFSFDNVGGVLVSTLLVGRSEGILVIATEAVQSGLSTEFKEIASQIILLKNDDRYYSFSNEESLLNCDILASPDKDPNSSSIGCFLVTYQVHSFYFVMKMNEITKIKKREVSLIAVDDLRVKTFFGIAGYKPTFIHLHNLQDYGYAAVSLRREKTADTKESTASSTKERYLLDDGQIFALYLVNGGSAESYPEYVVGSSEVGSPEGNDGHRAMFTLQPNDNSLLFTINNLAQEVV